MNEDLLYTLKLLSAILFNACLGKKVKFGIENILISYSFDSDIFCSIDLLFLWQQ